MPMEDRTVCPSCLGDTCRTSFPHDSGTVQEEACILGVPNVTICDVTERPETIECGSNVLAGTPDQIIAMVRLALERRAGWDPPAEYVAPAVARVVSRLGYRPPDAAELAC